MEADIYVKIRFKAAEEGGRRSAVDGDFYACPFLIEGKGFDCRLLLAGRRLELGETYEVPIKFLNLPEILPYLAEGQSFVLWEGKAVANGTVISIPSRDAQAQKVALNLQDQRLGGK